MPTGVSGTGVAGTNVDGTASREKVRTFGSLWKLSVLPAGCWAKAPPALRTRLRPRRLAAVRASVVAARAVVGRFLRNDDVMRMTLLHRRAAHHDEAAAGAQVLDIPAAAIAHAGP